MAQTGYTPIIIYGSVTSGNTPSASNLTTGATGVELAINAYDGKLFYKDASGVVQVLASKAGNINVSSLSFGTTGLTPNTATTGAITVAGTLITSNGGTGLASYTAGDLPYYASGTALSKLAIGTNGQILTSSGTAPQWSTLSGVAVTTFSGGTTGLTPNTATNGAITLGGTLNVANGGTGLTTLTSGYIPYGNGTSAFSSSSSLTYDGQTLLVNRSTPILTLTDTSSSNNSLRFVSNGGINYIQSGISGGSFADLTFTSNNGSSEKMRLTSAGYLGIGTSSPAQQLQITNSTYAQMRMNPNALYGSIIEFVDSASVTNAQIIAWGSTNATPNALSFNTGTTERMRIDSSGNVGIGTTSPSIVGPYASVVDIRGTTTDQNYGGALRLASNNGTTTNSYLLNTSVGLYIYNTKAGAIIFGTNNTEAARIDSSGNLLVGTTSQVGTAKITVAGNIAAYGYQNRQGTTGSNGGSLFNFYWNGNLQAWIDTSNVGNVTLVSDYRIKKDVVDAPEGLSRVMQLRPVTYKFKDIDLWHDDGQLKEGFIAHEVEEIIPAAVFNEKDGLTSDGKIQPQTLDPMPLISLLTKAIQELNNKFDAYVATHP